MDPDAPLAIGVLLILASTTIIITKMILGRGRWSGPSQKHIEALEERLTRIEQAIDSIAIETERISEGQRFTTKLLADRAQASDPAAPLPVTPGTASRNKP